MHITNFFKKISRYCKRLENSPYIFQNFLTSFQRRNRNVRLISNHRL